jgi:hypothetical protein
MDADLQVHLVCGSMVGVAVLTVLVTLCIHYRSEVRDHSLRTKHQMGKGPKGTYVNILHGVGMCLSTLVLLLLIFLMDFIPLVLIVMLVLLGGVRRQSLGLKGLSIDRTM